MIIKKIPIIAISGALVGYFFIHPLIMLLSHFMSSVSHPMTGFVYSSISSEVFRSFSISMLPWSIAFAIFSALLGFLYGKIKQAHTEKAKLIIELQDALAQVKTLSGLLPICSWCKQIRDDRGYWNQIESYIKEHTEAEFSHGICPACAKKHYPEFFKNDSNSNETA
jgi:hypothetical protein